ncbi:MAG: sulfur carrier protein ThiS [Vicinamibacterales bacterium]
MTITLNGDRYEIAGVGGSLTVAELLARLDIDPRRVAVEHNLDVVKRATFGERMVRDGDEVEIVNLVGGGSGIRGSKLRAES